MYKYFAGIRLYLRTTFYTGSRKCTYLNDKNVIIQIIKYLI